MEPRINLEAWRNDIYYHYGKTKAYLQLMQLELLLFLKIVGTDTPGGKRNLKMSIYRGFIHFKYSCTLNTKQIILFLLQIIKKIK